MGFWGLAFMSDIKAQLEAYASILPEGKRKEEVLKSIKEIEEREASDKVTD